MHPVYARAKLFSRNCLHYACVLPAQQIVHPLEIVGDNGVEAARRELIGDERPQALWSAAL
jgi:hypothetical protein